MKPNTTRNDNRVYEIVSRKVEMVAQIRDLRTQLAKLNVELLSAGASPAEIASW